MKPAYWRGTIWGIGAWGWGIALSDVQIRKAKPREKSYKLYDGGGLFVLVTTAGSKLFRMRYTWEGREKQLSFGPYPEVTLAVARDKCLAARAALRDKRDPGAPAPAPMLQVDDPSRSFEVVAREWHALQKARWTPKHADQVIDTLAADIFPKLGTRNVATITPPEMLEAIRGMEQRRAVETAHRVRQRCSAVFQHAIATGRATSDPAAVIAKALAPVVRGQQPALTDLAAVVEMRARVDAEPAYPLTKLALRMLALTSVRSTELRLMEWSEIQDLDGAKPLWRVPAERMKMKREHLVPLSRQAVEVLEAARQIAGGGKLAFPSNRWAHRPMSQNALGYLLNRAGYHGVHVPHGWRAAFSSIMNELHRADREVIDLMLAHVKGDKTEAAYNRAAHLDRRRELAQIWADMILEGAAPADELLAGLRKRPNPGAS